MNKRIDETFYEYADKEFDKYIADILYTLNTTSEEYKKIKEEQMKITRENPKISKVLYDKDIEVLTEDELCLLLNVLDYEENMIMLEEKELFYREGKEAFLFLRVLTKFNTLFFFSKVLYNYFVRLLIISTILSLQALLFYCKNDIIILLR